MNKQGTEYDLGDLCREVAEREGVTAETAKQIIRSTFEVIAEALVDESRVELHDIGVFSKRQRKERVYKFGDTEFQVPAHFKIGFKPSPSFAITISGGTGVPTK